jgi:hypothetical protein
MNRAQCFVFLPRWPKPFGRVVSAAALCGCELSVNDNLGATSFAMDLTDLQIYGRLDRKMGEEIERI